MPCSKFTYGTTLVSKQVIITDATYSGLNKADYEGEYLLTGEFIHSSDAPFANSADAKINYKVTIKLNCDDVTITEPAGDLRFSITPPANAPNFSGATVLLKDIHYWLRTTKTFPLHGMYQNPNPFSCTLQQTLGETTSGTSFDGPRLLSDLYITFNTPNTNNVATAIPSLTISTTVNRLPATS